MNLRRLARAAGMILGLAVLAAGSASAQTPAPPPRPADMLMVTLCGTSGPLPIPGRAKACVAIQAAGNLYLVDVGPESVENLLTWRLPLANAKAVFITHFHSDHIGDLGEFNMQSWVAGRQAALPVIGPKGIEEVVAGFNRAYAKDHEYRNAHHEHGAVRLPIAAGVMKPTAVTLPKPDPLGVATREVWSLDGLIVTAIAVEHSPAAPAFAYRFDYKGRSVVVSGDTRSFPPLAQSARGADVLIHEAQNEDMTHALAGSLEAAGQARLAAIMTNTVTYHTTPVQAAELARDAQVKTLVLTHLTQAGLPFYTPEAFTRGMDAVRGPPWKLAEDGMTIELPAGSDVIRYGHR
jgi:ribonuclease Z